MTDKYTLKFTPLASEDLESIFGYIYETLSSPTAAYRIMDEIENKINRLTIFPNSGSLITDDGLGSRGYRKVVADNYLAFYLIDETEKQIVIMRVLYGARDYVELL